MHRIILSKQIKCIVAIIAALILASALIMPTVAYIVTMTSSLVNTFVSGLDPEGDLIIRKTVEHPFGEGYVIPEGIDFEFRVDLGDAYAGKPVHTTQGEKTVDGDGCIFLNVKPGGSVGVRELTAGTNVVITELHPGAGFAVKGGEKSRTVTIRAMEETVVNYVNCYSPVHTTAADVTLSGIKNLVGRDWQAGDSFTFQLDWRFMGEKDSDWACLGTKSIVYESGVANFNCFDMADLLQDLKLGQVGTYAFRIAEIEGSIDGITYDDAIGYFDVMVTDVDMDGALEIGKVNGTSNVAVSQKGERYHVTVEFTNHYAPSGSAEVRIPVIKTLTDKSGQNIAPAGFAFELYDQQGVLVGRSEATSAAGETSIKLVYDASSAGQTFYYTLKELYDGQLGVKYDPRSYEVTVVVTDNLDGTIRADSTLLEAKFENIYDPRDTQIQISGSKELTGRELVEGEFEFDLYQTGSDFLVNKNDRPISTASNDSNGGFAFDKLVFEQVGSYYYVVKEDASANLGGVTYDETVYLVTVSVADQDGVLTAKFDVTNGGGETGQILFRNVYKAKKTSIQFSGLKTLQDAELKAEMFQFELYAADEELNTQGNPIGVVTNDAGGNFTFDEITYDTAGVYRYLIAEHIPEDQNGIVYDDTVYAVTVTVSDHGNGLLTADAVYTIVGGGTVDQIMFENVYMNEATDPTGPDTPPTGDVNLTWLWVVLTAACAGTLILILLLRPRKKD